MAQDYTDIYKRGLSSGIEKGKRTERDTIKNAVGTILQSDNTTDEKITAMAELLDIDKEVFKNGIVRDRTVGDNEQNESNEG